MTSEWQSALDFLYSFTNWETRRVGESGEHAFELERIGRLLKALGSPERDWPAVHIGGTNGKGSTSVMVASVLRAAGLRVGLYTSPHLHTVRERIQVNGELITEAEVIEWITVRGPLLEQFRNATTFEVLTAMAFEHFSRSSVDIAVVEVGLGGRLDTTRVVQPVVTALTPISLDHREVLGFTLRQIASDKVGILRPGIPLVTAPQEPEAETVIEAERLRLGCPRIAVGADLLVERGAPIDDGQRITISLPFGPTAERKARGLKEPFRVELGLEGVHQRVNAGVAAGICIALERSGWAIPGEAISNGLSTARWPARFERIPLGPGRPEVIVDGAHNPGAMRAMRASLAQRSTGSPIRLILGVGAGKDLDSMLDELLSDPAPNVIEVVATQSEHPKAMQPGDLAEIVAARGLDTVVRGTPRDALEHCMASATPRENIIATGSLFLAADIREALADMGVIDVPERDPPPVSTAR